MVDMSTTSAGLTWGMPVRPDLLGQALDGYEQSLPILTTLRLIHRFGKGPEAHITKLPVEILTAIEEMIYLDVRSKKCTWLDTFSHFEHRCDPRDHPGALEHAMDVATDVGPPQCDKCIARNAKSQDGDEECACCGCMAVECEDCNDKLEEVIDDILAETDWVWDECPEIAAQWESLISQKAKGNFVKYEQLLLKHFGLAVAFATTRVTTEQPKRWPTDNNHDHHYPEPLQTTTCFITLPREASKSHSYTICEGEADGGYANVYAAQSSFVDLPLLHNKELVSKQFYRLLRILRLQPYVHESQLNCRISAATNSIHLSQEPKKDSMTKNADRPEAGDEAEDVSETDQRKAAFDKMEWPQLVMLVQTVFQWGPY